MDDTWSLILVEGLYEFLCCGDMLCTSLVDRHDLRTTRESSLPPVDTISCIVVRTSDESSVHELDCHADSLRLRWMGDIEEREGHNL